MQCKIKETGAIIKLSIIDPESGVDWVMDMIGNAGALNDGRFEQDEDDADLYHVSREEYDWWARHIKNYGAMERKIAEAREQGMRETDIEYAKEHYADGDEEDGPQNVIEALKEAGLGMFYRKDKNGNAVIIDEDGLQVTRIMVDDIYPVGSELSTLHEHSDGIVLTIADAESIGITEE